MKDGQNIRALLLHAMKEKQQRQSAFRKAIRRQLGVDKQKQDDSLAMTETRIYIGLNDADTGEQIRETDEYLEQLKSVCQRYGVAFTLDLESGGYYHEDGRYVEENTYVMVLIDVDKDVVQNIAKDLCVLFNQESVLVTADRLDGFFINRES